jgi:hypothetical protein
LFIWGGQLFTLENRNKIVHLAKSLLEILSKGKCAITEEAQREDVNVVVDY